MKRIAILGATGSIGASAADVVRSHPDEFRVVAVSALSSKEKAEALGREFGASVHTGPDGAICAVEESEADICLVATAGISGLAPAVAAIEKGMDIALATKEVLVAGGEYVMGLAAKKGVKILPVDSEHSAIFQCLQGAGGPAAKLTLTASGGPFLDGPDDLSSVTPAQALAHPKWKMGPKVTIDSATMMNKGFETIEARWLFGMPYDRIDVVVHPESIVHSLVEFEDGATLAQLSSPDMRVAVQYALTWPRRLPAERARLDLAAIGSLAFRRPDPARFPCLRLVRDALAAGGCATAALAAADEWAVAAFLRGEIGFCGIPRAVEAALEACPRASCASIEAVRGTMDWCGAFLAEKGKALAGNA